VWIPESVQEIQTAARAANLYETSSFDGKKQLPVPQKNDSLAIDVAAMSTDGGTLLYGLGEDSNKRLTVEAPFTLAGAGDRVAQIIQTSISEPPYVDIREYPTEHDPTVGYLLVIVPQSARAPHQVTVNGDLRFYGRGAKGNRILTEGEIARLYARRQSWAQDQSALLERAIDESRFGIFADKGVVFACVAPVLADSSLWDHAVAATGGRAKLQDALVQAAKPQQASTGFHNFANQVSWYQLGADQVRLTTLAPNQPLEELPLYALDVEVRIDGSAFFSCGGVVQRRYGDTRIELSEAAVADNFASFLVLMSRFYELGAYHGFVDVGIALTGIAGTHSATIRADAFAHSPYNANEFRRTARLSAGELRKPRTVVSSVLRALFDITTGDPDFDAFTWRPT
jgi:hypothetical protein